MNMRGAIKAQSIMEYIITLAAIVVAIIIGTVGLQRGISTSLNATHDDLQGNLSAVAQGQTKDLTGLYGNPNNYTGNQTHEGYYFHQGPSDMSWVPAVGNTTSQHQNDWQPGEGTIND